MILLRSFICLFVLFNSSIGYSDDSTKVDQVSIDENGIRLEAFVEKTETPLNRTAILTIKIEWYGNLDKYEIHQFDNPLLQNLENILKAAESPSVVIVKLKSDAPIKIEYAIGDGRVIYYLAPRIENV